MHERWLVTGGLGFIGSMLIRRLVERGADVVNVDLDTYAGDERRVEDLSTQLRWERMDISDPGLLELVMHARPDVIVHLAAESHVTRSEKKSDLFFRTNVLGTQNVLQAAEQARVPLVVHISTDEVYGPYQDRPFKEEDKEAGEGRATSAYARSKALADDLALSFAPRLPLILIRPTNCFGPWQHPEKAIPRWVIRALEGNDIPVWGDGGYVRDWMFVEDACKGIELLVERGVPGQVYNLAPQGDPLTNLEIAQIIARAAGRDERAVYLTEYDRPQHDRRYAIDPTKARALGWRPSRDLESRLAETVEWYAAHRGWWESLRGDAEQLYEDERRRLADAEAGLGPRRRPL